MANEAEMRLEVVAPSGEVLRRRLPIGAECVPGGVHFRVWAPNCRRVEVVLEDDSSHALAVEPGGYFAALVAEAEAGTRYRFRLDGAADLCADPASRFQPEGPLGPSEVIDPARFAWSDDAWPGVSHDGQVLYEMHIGTFTAEGTWAAAQRQLKALAELGITVIELMPVADFVGRFNWGYDGVDLFAPTRLYGRPDDFRQFVDAAHGLGLGVILDVVYNHLGAVGNVLPNFSKTYFSETHTTDWGDAINFDGPDCAPVREFFLANVEHWISEFHLDGLRIDATQNIYDCYPGHEHILTAMARRARAAAGRRAVYLVGENEPQEVRLLRPPEAGGHGLDALWNDDFHHSAMVALTGHAEAYYMDYRGRPQEFVSLAKHGFLYQGQHYRQQGKRRGTPTRGLNPAALITYLQNHDQIANSAHGLRAHALSHPGRFRAMTALLLLGPGTPLLFQGQEFCASSPFLFFADQPGELADLVHRGRCEFLSQFPSIASPEMRARLPRPGAWETFARCKLDHGERETHASAYALHRDLLRLRREDGVLGTQRAGAVDGAVLDGQAFVLRFLAENGADRLLVVNLGPDLDLASAPEPLLAPPEGMDWRLLWSSEDPRYGGSGTPPVHEEGKWRLPGEAAVAFAPISAVARVPTTGQSGSTDDQTLS